MFISQPCHMVFTVFSRLPWLHLLMNGPQCVSDNINHFSLDYHMEQQWLRVWFCEMGEDYYKDSIYVLEAYCYQPTWFGWEPPIKCSHATQASSTSSQVKCIYRAHLKETHTDQSAVQLNHNKISIQIENRNKTIRSKKKI